MKKVAILVDGGFYRKRAGHVKGHVTPKERAEELHEYCRRHLKERSFGKGQPVYDELYRIFYYDCAPISKQVYHPLTQRTIDFGKSELKEWTESFFTELAKMRKVALRLGELSDGGANFNLKPAITKQLLSGKKDISNLEEKDFSLSFQQKGVDMRIGLDIASLSFKKQVDKIILIAGDSDFVPAAKMARREGIDFILDSLGNPIKESLSEHIDGRKSCDDDYRNHQQNNKTN